MASLLTTCVLAVAAVSSGASGQTQEIWTAEGDHIGKWTLDGTPINGQFFETPQGPLTHFEIVDDEVWTAQGDHIRKWTYPDGPQINGQYYEDDGAGMNDFNIVGNEVWTAVGDHIERWTLDGYALVMSGIKLLTLPLPTSMSLAMRCGRPKAITSENGHLMKLVSATSGMRTLGRT